MSNSDQKQGKKGSRYLCDVCGFEVLVVTPCLCDNGDPAIFCCDKKTKYIQSQD